MSNECREATRACRRLYERAPRPGAKRTTGRKKRKKTARSGRFQIADKPSPSAGFLFFDGVMLKTPMPTQHELEMVTLEELVPKDHL
ncbi:hypothetical protein, partial [Burkholderia pseudomallei]|uniref:hypothetical protein n=1 Tax=Burkholderia pseudomallei TaxID=28450 RepID=UPI0016060A7F